MIIFIFIEVKLMTNMLQMYNIEVHNFKGYIPFIVIILRRKCQPTPIFLPGKFCGQGAWWATVYEVTEESDMTWQLNKNSYYKILAISSPCCKIYLHFLFST